MKEKIGIWNTIVSVLSLKSLALKSGDQLLLLLFVSYVSLTMISCPGNVFARVISGRCEAGHYRQQNKGWWTRSAINIPPLEFLNLHQYEKKSK